VSGVAQPDATNVAVTISDPLGHTVTAPPVAPVGGVYTTARMSVSGLSDGTLTATPTFTVPGQPPFVGATMTIRKDVVVPLAPVASPSGGTFTSTKAVTLDDDDQTAKIHYTLAGTTPSPASPVFGALISVDHSLTIRAIAVDAAGNASPEASFPFTIVSPAAVSPTAPASGAGTTTIIQQVPFLLPLAAPSQAVAGNRVASPARPAVRGLTVAVGHGRALRIAMRPGSGAKVVRLRVLRASGGSALLTAVRSVSAGRVTITLSGPALRHLRAGAYLLEARAGASRGALGAATRTAFRLR